MLLWCVLSGSCGSKTGFWFQGGGGGWGWGGGCDGSWEVKPEIGLGYRRSDSLS